jgi:hypothetical protein
MAIMRNAEDTATLAAFNRVYKFRTVINLQSRLQFYRLHAFLESKITWCPAIPVRGRGGPQGCETLRLPHFRDNRLTDGGKVVSVTHLPPFRKISSIHFCSRMSRPQGHNAVERIRSIEKPNVLSGNRSRNLPACSIVP